MNVEDKKLIVILAGHFPWSPTILTSRYNLKVFVWNQSRLLPIASAYYSRFKLSPIPASSFSEFESSCKVAHAVVDEGWPFSPQELQQASRIARYVPFFKVGGGYNLSTQDSEGRPKIWKVKHSNVGGATDLESKMVEWYSRKSGPPSAMLGLSIPSVDLRSILKTGIEGAPSAKPWVLPEAVVEKVMFLRKGEISAAGLFPLKGAKEWPLVRTRFGVRNWVTRELTGSEVLLLKDIPEPLSLMLSYTAGAEAMTRFLFDSCQVPLKSLSAMLLPALEALTTPAIDKLEEVLESGNRNVTLGNEEVPIEERNGKTSMGSTTKTREELEAEEKSCQSASDLVEVLQRRFSAGSTESRSKKSDYEVPSETIWDIKTLPYCRVREGTRTLDWRCSFKCLREAMLRNWKRGIVRSIIRFRMEAPGFKLEEKDKMAIRECLEKVSAVTAWGWEGGSRPFFWNWPHEWRLPMRDGFQMWLKPVSVTWKQAQPKPSEKGRALMMKKLLEVRSKGYLSKGSAKAYLRFFGVPKGDSDVRMVYDGTKSGLNDALWAPWFPLPTASTHLRMTDHHSWMADNDAGECFLNWMLDLRVQELCGVDLTHFLSLEEQKKMLDQGENKWVELWTRCAMGLRPSPYICVKGMMLAKEVILGNSQNPHNVFCWNHVLLNLPGMECFDPSKPWVSKRRENGQLAADLIGFVDDLRPIAPTEGECWEASQVVAKHMAHLGTQDASRKRNPPSQSPGPWAGIVIITNDNGVYVSVSEKKWEKAGRYIREICGELEKGKISFKSLECKVGYLVYVAQAYPSMKPYLSALYGTLNSWRPNRSPDGFKIINKTKRRKLSEVRNELEERDFEEDDQWRCERWDRDDEEKPTSSDGALGILEKEAPREVRFVNGSKDCLEALVELTESAKPPLRRIRGGQPVSLVYGFGDASGSGFGSAIQLANGDIFYRSGLWSGPIAQESSSNYRELRNLVEAVEHAGKLNLLKGCQLMLFTDNTTAERAFHKGGSASPLLHKLILRLRKLELSLGIELMVVHVSGKRMIESGVDGISRGDMNAGMMAGQSVYAFIPLHLSAEERSPKLVNWIKGWAGKGTEILNSDRWPDVQAAKGTYVWIPPPAAADAAVDWLGESIHKRSSSIHIVAIPRLMTARWRKTLGKIGDLQVEIPCGIDVWPTEMLEPLVLVVSLPLSKFCSETGTWRFKNSPRICELETTLPLMWKNNFEAVGDSLRKLLCQARRVRSM